MSVYSSTPGQGPLPHRAEHHRTDVAVRRRHQHLVLTQLHVGGTLLVCCRRPAHRRRSTTPCRWASTGRAVRARRRATPVELQVRCRRLLRDDDGMSSLTVATTPVIANRSDGRWVIREVSNRVEFLLDGRRLSDFLRRQNSAASTIRSPLSSSPRPTLKQCCQDEHRSTPPFTTPHGCHSCLSLRRPVVRRPHRATRRGCGRHTLV